MALEQDFEPSLVREICLFLTRPLHAHLVHAFPLRICKRHTQINQITEYIITMRQDETTGTQAAHHTLDHHA
jgi:hypothetical protein